MTCGDASGGEALVVVEANAEEQSLSKKKRGHGLWWVGLGSLLIGADNLVTGHTQWTPKHSGFLCKPTYNGFLSKQKISIFFIFFITSYHLFIFYHIISYHLLYLNSICVCELILKIRIREDHVWLYVYGIAIFQENSQNGESSKH